LKSKLLEKLQNEQPHRTSVYERIRRPFGYAFGGMVLTAAAFLFILAQTDVLMKEANEVMSDAMLSGSIEISQADDQAFGSLVAGDGMQAGDNIARESAPSGMGAQGGSFDALDAPMMPTITEENVGGGTPTTKAERIMPPYRETRQTYLYTGDNLSETYDATVSVLKRIKGKSNTNVSSALKQLNFGLIDLDTFPQLSLENMSVKTGDDHYITVDMNEEAVYIVQNSPIGILEPAACTSRMCTPTGLDVNAVPAESTLIEKANAFLTRHSINTEIYGDPEIEASWKRQFEAAKTDPSHSYLSETVPVIYPLMINGTYVHDQGGNKTGMTVNVNARTLSVTGVWNMTTHTYQSSNYAAETDISKIVEYAEQGGYTNAWVYYGDEQGSSEPKPLEITTPYRAYVTVWTYREDIGQSQELLVPALIFPVVKTADTHPYLPDHIVVPLAKELIQQQKNEMFPYPTEPEILPAQ
jgi:hypothetical protein